jgi:AcrR family transcriptional regulator
MSPRKSAQSELTKEAILDAARELFVAQGYSSASMRKVAQALNCSHGALYYHFKNKAELFYGIAEQGFEKLNALLKEIMSRTQLSNEEKLFEILLGYIRFGLTHQKHYEVMFLIRDEELDCYMQEAPYESYQHFAEAIAVLLPKPPAAQQIWSAFISLHGFVTHFSRSEAEFEETQGLARTHARFIIGGLEAASAP